MLKSARKVDLFDGVDIAGPVSPKTGNRLDLLYSLFCEYHEIGDWTIDLESGEARWSDEVFRIHGFEPTDGVVPVDAAIERFNPDDAVAVRKLVETAATTGQGYRFRLRLKTKNGETKLVESIGGVAEERDGKIIKLAGIFHDVTEDETAKIRADHLAGVVKTFTKDLPISLIILDAKMKVVDVSDYWLYEFGLKRASVKGKNYYKLLPDIPAELKEAHKAALKGKRKRIQSVPISTAADAPWCNWMIQPWVGADGAITGVLIASQRQKIEAQERPADQVVSDHQLQVLDHAPSALMCMNLDNNMFSYANKAALQLLGLSFDEAVDQLTADRVFDEAILEHIRGKLLSASVCGPLEVVLDCAALGLRSCYVRASRVGHDNPRMLVLELSLVDQHQTDDKSDADKGPAIMRKPGIIAQLLGAD